MTRSDVSKEMIAYYAKRASPEYDAFYDYPYWQGDVAALKALIVPFFEGHDVFEVACGPGYWTREVASVAKRTYSTDINDETLAIARTRLAPFPNVTLARADAYAPLRIQHKFNAGLAGFWLSHVDLARMGEFLTSFHTAFEPGSRVMFFDQHKQASPGKRPHSRIDEAGNRYEMRPVSGGAQFEIIKNFLTEEQLKTMFFGYGQDFEYQQLEHVWVLKYGVA